MQGSRPPRLPQASGGRERRSQARRPRPQPPSGSGARCFFSFACACGRVLGNQTAPRKPELASARGGGSGLHPQLGLPADLRAEAERGLCAGREGGQRCPAGVSHRAAGSSPGSGIGTSADHGWTSGVSPACHFRPVCGQRVVCSHGVFCSFNLLSEVSQEKTIQLVY